jgi:hypothetical protein
VFNVSADSVSVPSVVDAAEFDETADDAAALVAVVEELRDGSSADSATGLGAEDRALLRRLEGNRAQLLGTGVYTAADPIIVDMDRKIAAKRALLL